MSPQYLHTSVVEGVGSNAEVKKENFKRQAVTVSLLSNVGSGAEYW